MQGNFQYLIISILIVVAISCYPTPELPVEPYIEYRSIRFVETSPVDSLILTFYFEDGDGDIGLVSDDIFPPFHPFYRVVDSRDSLVTISSEVVPPLYLVIPGYTGKAFLSDDDIRPPYNCEEYYFESGSQANSDTLFVQKNEYFSNIHVTFYRKIFGVYHEVEISPNCPVDFNARIPVFEVENVINQQPISGTISYVMPSNGFKFYFGNDTFKVDFYIYDRSLNKSNVVTSPDLRLLDAL